MRTQFKTIITQNCLSPKGNFKPQNVNTCMSLASQIKTSLAILVNTALAFVLTCVKSLRSSCFKLLHTHVGAVAKSLHLRQREGHLKS